MRNEDEKLDRLLRQWRCQAADNPGLGSGVWQRIADREEATWMGRGLSVWMGQSLVGPALAATLFLAAILAGVGAAELRMQRTTGSMASMQSPEQAYFESINPVALARHAEHP